MRMENPFSFDIEKIHLAHEFTLDRTHKCEYRTGRGLYGLVYVISGEAQYRFVSGEEILLRCGDVLFIRSTSAYSIFCEEEFLHYTVNFSLHESEEGDAPSPYLLLDGEHTVGMERLFRRLVGIWREKDFAYEMLSVALLYELLGLLARETRGELTHAYQRLMPARSYIESHLTQDFTLAKLAKLSSMSQTNFRREWHKCFSQTPMAYRDMLRLSLAKEYLGSGYYTVGEVALKCGFEDTSYFVRFFKKKVGVTPKVYSKKPT